MKTTVFVFHPHLDESSKVNKLYVQKLKDAGYEVRDLYKLYPDFKIDVAQEQAALTAADRIVLLFPMYWYSSPALLKQWEDDVLAYGWAYGGTTRALEGKELLLVVSAGAPAEVYTHEHAYTVTDLLRPFQASACYTGMKYLKPYITTGALGISSAVLAEKAQRLIDYVKTTDIGELGTHE